MDTRIESALDELSFSDIAEHSLQLTTVGGTNAPRSSGNRAPVAAGVSFALPAAPDLATVVTGIESTVNALLASSNAHNAGTGAPKSDPGLTPSDIAPVRVDASLPTDPIFAQQWHLHQTIPGLYDLDVTAVWDMGYTGAGITVAVIDNGFDYTHPDLSPNYLLNMDHDYFPSSGVNDPNDAFGNSTDHHGTEVMGIIGAARNGSGAVGVAYDSSLIGYRTDEFIEDTWLQNIHDAIHDGAIVAGADVISISQGQSNYAPTVFGGFLTQSLINNLRAAIGEAVDSGRGGLGSLVVKAAGNSRGNGGQVSNYDVNADMWANDTRQVVVGAVDQDGTVSAYSSYGAAILVSAFGTPFAGEVVTTDRGGLFSTNFNGTSAATPMVAGVISLMLDANPNLGWRDVQSILAASARHVGSVIDGSTTDGIERTPWVWNGGNDGNLWNGGAYHFSNDYGYGLVDAAAAVRMAETWLIGRSAQTSANQAFTFEHGLHTPTTIPDGNSNGTSFSITESDSIQVERVALTMSFSTTYIGDLEVYLVSPDGTTSELVRDTLSGDTSGDEANDFSGTWTFESQMFRGELSGGTWHVRIVDDQSVDTLTVSDLVLRTYGSAFSTSDRWVFTNEFSNYKGAANHSTHINDVNGGTDTINAAAVTTATTIDLTAHTGTIDGVAVTVYNIENVITGIGNDRMVGSSGVNTFDGGRGNDFFKGGGGNDRINGGSGTDTADYSDKTTAVSVTLNGSSNVVVLVNGVAEDTIRNVEALVGGSGKDILRGDSRANYLTGGLGQDSLTGGTSADEFLFRSTLGYTNIDRITDFSHVDDIIGLDNAVMAGLGTATGALSSSRFIAKSSGHVATTTSQRIIYDKHDGSLWYDQDGSGSHGAVEIAILTNKPTYIDYHDFMIV